MVKTHVSLARTIFCHGQIGMEDLVWSSRHYDETDVDMSKSTLHTSCEHIDKSTCL